MWRHLVPELRDAVLSCLHPSLARQVCRSARRDADGRVRYAAVSAAADGGVRPRFGNLVELSVNVVRGIACGIDANLDAPDLPANHPPQQCRHLMARNRFRPGQGVSPPFVTRFGQDHGGGRRNVLDINVADPATTHRIVKQPLGPHRAQVIVGKILHE